MWKYGEKRTVAKTRVFSVDAENATADNGAEGEYYTVNAPDWATVIAPVNGKLVTVRQWRHGAKCMTVELPGGIIEPGEDPAAAAARELEEETGYKAEKLVKLAEVNPNPALFKNTLHVFLAEGVTASGKINPDPDEFIEIALEDEKTVSENFGSGEYINAFMGTALALYERYKRTK